jgi:hypothetical protein
VTVLDWTTNPYPLPRKNRRAVQPPTPEAAQTLTSKNPRTFNWTWNLRGNVSNTRNSIASRKVVGPLIVKSITATFNNIGAINNTLPILGLNYQTTPYTAVTSQTPVLAPTGTPIFEQQYGGVINLGDTAGEGYSHSPLQSAATGYTIPINRIITDPEVYFTIFLDFRGSSGDGRADGLVQIYEDIDLNDAILLIG